MQSDQGLLPPEPVEAQVLHDSPRTRSEIPLPRPIEQSNIEEKHQLTLKTLQIIGSWFLYMNAWGMLNSFGTFQTFYKQDFIQSESESRIAWIGSLQGFLLLFVGILVGPVIDAGYLRHVIALGTFLVAFGLFMTSLSKQYYQLILAQGMTMGIGAGCIFLPSITLVPQWFSPKRSPLALGIVATGSSVGGVIFPAMFHSIQKLTGFGWAVRAIAFLSLGTNIFGIFALRYKGQLPDRHRELFNFSMLKEPYFMALCIALFFTFIGLYVPIFFIQSYYATLSASAGHGNYSPSLTFWVVPILMAGSLPGRLAPNILAASYVGNVNMIVLMVMLCSVLSFYWIAMGHGGPARVVVFALFYGFTSGGVVSLIPPVVVSTAPTKQKLATRMGMALTCASLGVLIGNPVAGAILSAHSSENFKGVQIFAGVVLMAASLAFLIVKGLKLNIMLRKLVHPRNFEVVIRNKM